MERSATFSPDRRYRYVLQRTWDRNKELCAFICLNPSTADENIDDPTVKKCMKYCMRWGYGTFYMLNLFAFRATNPKEMLSQDDPIGPENDKAIHIVAIHAHLVVVAWGVHGAHRQRDEQVLDMLKDRDVACLRTTKDVMPKHPLYCRDDCQLFGYRKNEVYLLDKA